MTFFVILRRDARAVSAKSDDTLIRATIRMFFDTNESSPPMDTALLENEESGERITGKSEIPESMAR